MSSNHHLSRLPHLNNKQNKNTNPVFSRQDYHLTHSCPSEEKQRNKQTKPSRNLTLYKAYTNHWTNLRRAETKMKKEFNLLQEIIQLSWKPGKGDLKHSNLKKR